MTAQKGRELLVKYNSTGSTYVTVAGGRSSSISLNQETVDVTNAGSAGLWRELLANGGVRTATITFSGIFVDSTSEDAVRGQFFAGTHKNFQFVIPDFGHIQGPFAVSSIDYSGEYNGEITYSMTFESAGALTWTAT